MHKRTEKDSPFPRGPMGPDQLLPSRISPIFDCGEGLSGLIVGGTISRSILAPLLDDRLSLLIFLVHRYQGSRPENYRNMQDTKEDLHLHSSSSHFENMAEADERGAASVPGLKLSIEEQDVNNPQVRHNSRNSSCKTSPNIKNPYRIGPSPPGYLPISPFASSPSWPMSIPVTSRWQPRRSSRNSMSPRPRPVS